MHYFRHSSAYCFSAKLCSSDSDKPPIVYKLKISLFYSLGYKSAKEIFFFTPTRENIQKAASQNIRRKVGRSGELFLKQNHT